MAKIQVYPMGDEHASRSNQGQGGNNSSHHQPKIVKGSASFRPQARLIRMLGEELISDESMAVLELVKNSYDADAQEVVISFGSSSGTTIDTIEIRDNGDGMDLETILTAWLEPATRRKRGGRWKQRTPLGRFPLGEKGVGRFAVDKLGAELELIARTHSATEEVVLNVGWSLFEAEAYLDEVESHWELRSPKSFTDDTHGTLIRINNLRTRWDKALLERVQNSLSRLISPNADAGDFAIILECSLFPELSGRVKNPIIDRAPYWLRGRVDSDGVLHVTSETTEQSQIDLCMKIPERFLGENGTVRPPLCGPFTLALYAWDLDTVGLRQAGIDRTMRTVLKQWTGVSIYRDRFRVLPYGEKDNDWLQLNQRRVNNPTLRLSNNQVIGIVEITQQDNPELRDRTSREGMIDCLALDDLKQLVLSTLSHLEEGRFKERRPVQKNEQVSVQGHDPVMELMQQIKTQGEDAASKTVLSDLEYAYKKRIEEYQRREENLLRLAGLGVAAERVIQDLSSIASSAMTLTDILKNHATTLTGDSKTLNEPLRLLNQELSSLQDQLDILFPLRSNSPDGYEHLELRDVVQDAIVIFARHFRTSGISVTLTENGNPRLYARYGHIVQIMLALLDNAVYWLRNTSQHEAPAIRIHLWANQKRGGIILADNGPGISPTIGPLIFEPSYTTRRDGLGLGLFIVRSLIQRYEGSIEVLDENLLLPGANIQLQFKIA